jgi:tetratricopeptide (TPR) repeat protein
MKTGDYVQAERSFLRLASLMPEVPELYSNLGLAFYYQNKYEQARHAFDRSLSLNRHLFVPNYFLARLDCEEGRYAEALPLLQAALVISPDEPTAQHLLAEVQLQLGSYEDAIRNYEKILSINENDEESLSGISRAYLQQAKSLALRLKIIDPRFASLLKGESEAASKGLEEWNDSVAGLADVPQIRIPLANALLRKHRVADAERALLRELQLDPASYEALYLLANCRLLQGDTESAATDIDRAAHIRPELFQPLPPLVELPTNPEAILATIRSNDGATEFGRAYLMTEISSAINHPEDTAEFTSTALRLLNGLNSSKRDVQPVPSAEQRVQAGLTRLREKRFEDGLLLLAPIEPARFTKRSEFLTIERALMETGQIEQAISIVHGSTFAQDPEVLYLLANAYKSLAIRSMDDLARLNPQSLDLLRLRAESLSDRRMYSEAIEAYGDALRQYPNAPDLHFGLGEAYFNQMQFQQAEESYARAMELLPSDPSSCVMRAQALIELQRADEAIALARRALSLNPALLQAHLTLGRAYSAVGRNAEAVQELEKAVSLDEDGTLHYELFKLYRKTGDNEKAEHALRVSLDLRRRKNVSANAAPDASASAPH